MHFWLDLTCAFLPDLKKMHELRPAYQELAGTSPNVPQRSGGPVDVRELGASVRVRMKALQRASSSCVHIAHKLS